MYDVIIIGAGPAGLSAAVYATRAQLNALVLEQNAMSGGQIINTYEIDNYLGLPGIGGFDLAVKFEEHAKKLGAGFSFEDVIGIDFKMSGTGTGFPVYTVVTGSASYETACIIFAAGATPAKLAVPGEEEFAGRGVSYCATCDGAFFKNKTALVVGGGDVAVEDAVFLSRICNKVYLVHRRDALRAAKILQKGLFALKNVEVIWNSVVSAIEGTDAVERVIVSGVKSGTKTEIETDACFIAVGTVPHTQVMRGLVNMNEAGYIEAGENCATSAPGIFAAGDCRVKPLRQVITAAADGACAVNSVQEYLLKAKVY